MPLPFSSLTCRLLFFASGIYSKLLKLTVEEVLNLLHVDLQEAAFDVELDRWVSLLYHLEEVGEHPWQEPFEVLVIEVGALCVVRNDY